LQTERRERDARSGRGVRGPDGWPVRRGDRRDSRRRADDDDEDPFAKAEAEERAFRAANGGFASGNRDAPRGPGDARGGPREADASFGGARDAAAAAEAPRAGGPPGGFGGGGGGFRERDTSFPGSRQAGYGAGTGGGTRELDERAARARAAFAGPGPAGDIPMPPPRGAGGADFLRGPHPHPPGAFGSGSAARATHAGAHRAFADVSLGPPRGREGGGARAPPLPPGAPPGAPRRPEPRAGLAPPEDERDVERDAFQAELERVVAEQEAERRRREAPGGDLQGAERNHPGPGAPRVPNPGGGGAEGAPADARAAGWPRTARELAGSALVSHSPAQTPGVPLPPPGVSDPGSRLYTDAGPMPAPSYDPTHSDALPTGFDPSTTPFGGVSLAEDAETRKKEERKKRGGRRVREAEERRAAKNGAENASAASALGGTMATYPDTAHGVLSGSGSFPGRGGRGAGPGTGTGPPAPSAAAGGWGAGALGGLAWAGPIAEIQRSASSDALAHAARARLASDQGAPGRADAAAAMSSAAAAAAAAAAHHHQAAAASNAFAYESAIAALGALVDRGAPAGGDIGIRGVDDRAGGGEGGDRHGHPGGVSVPRPAFGRPAPPGGGAPIGRGSVGLGFGGGLWSAAGPPPPPGAPPLPPGPPPPAHARTGAQGGAALSPGGAAATLVAAAALEDD